jgi:hypothetical protein
MVDPFARSATRQIARGAVASDCTGALAPSRRVSTAKTAKLGFAPFAWVVYGAERLRP